MKKTDRRRSELREYVENRFKSIYPFKIAENGFAIFDLPDGLKMSVFSIGGKHFDSLGINYTNSPEFGDDDGDLYHIDDFETPEDLFNAMLNETKLCD